MEIKYKNPEPVRFDRLMWNDTFVTNLEERDVVFLVTNPVTGKTTKTERINAVAVGFSDNSKSPLRFFGPEYLVYKVYIVKMELQFEG